MAEATAPTILPPILPDSPRRPGAPHRLLDALLPSVCVLCGGVSGAHVLCPGCAADLPALPETLCPQCAQPTTHGERCGQCLQHPPHFERTVALFAYQFPADALIHALKYGHRLPLAAWFGQRLAVALQESRADLVIPLPLHKARWRQRGFNQSAEIARHLAAGLGLPLAANRCQRRKATRNQAELPLKERPGNVRGVFEAAGDFAGQHLLLVDDVMTSGATLNECARMLKRHGAGDITAAVVARTLRQ